MHKEPGHTTLDEMRSQWRLMTFYERFEQVVSLSDVCPTLARLIGATLSLGMLNLWTQES